MFRRIAALGVVAAIVVVPAGAAAKGPPAPAGAKAPKYVSCGSWASAKTLAFPAGERFSRVQKSGVARCSAIIYPMRLVVENDLANKQISGPSNLDAHFRAAAVFDIPVGSFVYYITHLSFGTTSQHVGYFLNAPQMYYECDSLISATVIKGNKNPRKRFFGRTKFHFQFISFDPCPHHKGVPPPPPPDQSTPAAADFAPVDHPEFRPDLVVLLNDNSTGGTKSIGESLSFTEDWDMGDGTHFHVIHSSNGESSAPPTCFIGTVELSPDCHIYANPGTYQITLAVNNSSGQTSSVSHTVTVLGCNDPPPVPQGVPCPSSP
jgi:hypothetical protein